MLYLPFNICLGLILILFSYRLSSGSLGLRVGEANEIISFFLPYCHCLFSTASASGAGSATVGFSFEVEETVIARVVFWGKVG